MGRLALATAASVVIHAIFAASFGLYEGERGLASPSSAERDRTPLGIDRSDATTITWIGFEEPTPNEARRSTIEQAAQEIGGGRPAAPAIRRVLREAQERATDAARGAIRAMERAAREIELASAARDAPAVERDRTETEPAGEPRDGDAAEAARVDPAPVARAAERPGNADRQADAVSIEEPVEIEWGRPIAAEGLEILTRKKGPNYSAYTRVATRPDPPLVEISFDPDGRVAYVEFVRSSGVADVDRPLKDAIYAWGARGERIDALGPGEVVKVRLRILIR